MSSDTRTASRTLLIRIKKATDGRTSLSCTREDGTTTWQTLQGGQAAFFPAHDLTHYAVETTLGHSQGFYGLVAAGWDLSDFGNPWPRGKLPPEAIFSEMIVGCLDRERASGQFTAADVINSEVESYAADNGLAAPEPITEDDVTRVRQARGDLFARWRALPPGEALELRFAAFGRQIC